MRRSRIWQRGGCSDERENECCSHRYSRSLDLSAPAIAQDAETEKAIERYRQMLKEDPWSNPGLLDSDRGEALWKTPRGPKNVTLEQCDLGKGPGEVDGAFAELPRYFADADRVMDVETRILWCMEKLQGFNPRRSREEAASGRRPAGEGARRDRDLRRQQVAGHEVRRQARSAEGERGRGARRGHVLPPLGAVRFCLRDLPRRSRQAHPAAGPAVPVRASEARKVVGEWPAYRVSTTHVMTMQHRLLDCYWQMRMPQLELGSDASVALIAYLTKTAEGGEISAPGLKR